MRSHRPTSSVTTVRWALHALRPALLRLPSDSASPAPLFSALRCRYYTACPAAPLQRVPSRVHGFARRLRGRVARRSARLADSSLTPLAELPAHPG